MGYTTSVNDIVARWRPLAPSEEAVAPQLLADAGEILDSHRPALAALVADGKVSQVLVTIALVRCVKRVLRNIDEVRAQNIGADGSIAVTHLTSSTGTATRDGLYFLPDDLADLDRAVAAIGGEAGGNTVRSVRLSAYDETPLSLTTNLPTP